MSKKINVLVFPAGEINSVELHEALSHQVNIRVFGASSVDRHGPYVFERYRSGLPFISAPDFLEKFNALLQEWCIDYIFPTHDTVTLFLAENRGALAAQLIAASTKTALVCRDKKLTYDLFAEELFCPTVYQSVDRFPCFIKPRDGQGSQGAKLLRSADDLPADFAAEEYVITEYLPGQELTVDCLTDKNGRLAAALPRERTRTMAGVSVAGSALVLDDEVREIAETINARLSFCGLWYFQLKQDDNGRYKLLEISTRCAGTMCLSRARGVNLPLLSIYAAAGYDITVFENPCAVKVDRTLISRYTLNWIYSTAYVDYDDTVVEGELVCLPVIRYLYQCRNRGIRVVLLTRHELDHEDSLEESLQAHAISPQIFDEIVRIPAGREKAEYILDKQSVFIDNAYAERKKVHDALGIPVFDVEGMEVLSDWRC